MPGDTETPIGLDDSAGAGGQADPSPVMRSKAGIQHCRYGLPLARASTARPRRQQLFLPRLRTSSTAGAGERRLGVDDWIGIGRDVDRRRPIGGELDQDGGCDVEWRARRKKHRDNVERDLGIIGEIAEIGANRRAEICRSSSPINVAASSLPQLSSASLPCLSGAHNFTRPNYFNDLSALLCNFLRLRFS